MARTRAPRARATSEQYQARWLKWREERDQELDTWLGEDSEPVDDSLPWEEDDEEFDTVANDPLPGEEGASR